MELHPGEHTVHSLQVERPRIEIVADPLTQAVVHGIDPARQSLQEPRIPATPPQPSGRAKRAPARQRAWSDDAPERTSSTTTVCSQKSPKSYGE